MVDKKRISVIFFDIGGVLLDIHPDRMLRKISDFTKTPFQVVKESFPKNAHDKYERGQISDEDWHMAFNDSLPKNVILESDHFWQAWSALLGEETEVIDILIQLKNDYKIWLLSNTNPNHIIKEIENSCIFPSLADGKIYSFDVGFRKPEIDIYKIACSKADINPESSVFIDDLKDNIVGAKKIGMHGIHYKNIKQLKKDLKILGILNE